MDLMGDYKKKIVHFSGGINTCFFCLLEIFFANSIEDFTETFGITQILFARHFFCRALRGSNRNICRACGFDRVFHRNIWNHLDFVCSTFLLRSNLRVGQNYMASWSFFFSKFFLLIRSSIWQKYCLASNEISLQLRETKSLLAGVILPSESSLELRSQIRTLSQPQEQESCQRASSGTLNKHTLARKETRDAVERTAVAVNLRQHRQRQLLRGNGCEWFLERGCKFCSITLLQQNVVSQTERTK